jgi:hypothetical protein
VLEQASEGELWKGLVRDEGSIDGGECEPRQMIGVSTTSIETEHDLHLLSEADERHLPHPVHDPMDFPLAGIERLGRLHDEDPQEVRVFLECRGDGVDERLQVFRLRPRAPVDVRQRLEEALGPPLHDCQQHAFLGAEVVVDRTRRYPGFLHEPRDCRRFVALLGHQPLCGIEHYLARAGAAAIRGYLGSGGHG